jgi:LemA protein
MIEVGLVIGIIVVLIIVIVLGYILSIYNSFVRLKNNIEKAWANIDVLLKQRQDELTNLIEAVKGYMKYEKKVLTQVTQARTAFMNANSVADKANADNMMASAVKSIFAVAENYPKLLANENFMQLQERISNIENQIADRREFYNDSVTIFNTRTEQVPYVFIATMLHYVKKELFKASDEERKNVNVSM